MSERIHKMTEQDISLRERNFNDIYGFPVTITEGITFLDADWNYDMVIIKFRDVLGKVYGLVEHYPAGSDNSTKFVLLEYEDKYGKFCQEKYEKFIDAEKAMVELMQKRQRGEDS